MKRFRFFCMLILLLILCPVLFSLSLSSIVKASGSTIYIRADGSVDPPTAPIQRDGNVYTLTGDISDQIEIQRNNMTLNGAGYAVQETSIIGSGRGIYLWNINNVTIKNLEIIGFQYGIYLAQSHDIHISQNNITNNGVVGGGGSGIYIYSGSSNNVLAGNKITNNWGGIWLYYSSNNTLTGNLVSDNKYSLEVDGSSLSHFMHSIDASNLIDSKPVRYLVNQTNAIVNSEAGYLGLINCVNITVEGLNLRNNWQGLLMAYTNNSKITANNIANNLRGIWLQKSSNNTLVGNNVTANDHYGIYLSESSRNRIYNNNIRDNTNQAADGNNNAWDDGYPSGGNFWSNYNGNDSNHDGIGDSPQNVEFNNKDNYPLMGMFHCFKTSSGYRVNVISNSTIEDFQYFGSNRTIRMHVSSITSDQAFGFCRVTSPHTLMDNPEVVRIAIDDGQTEVLFENATLYDNSTHRWIYFAYKHSTHEVIIQSDTASPVISVLSPENKTYTVSDVTLNFTLSESTSWMAYSLDNKANVTVTGNTTLSKLPNGSHSIIVYAKDTAGNFGTSETIYFSIAHEEEPFPTAWIIAAIVIIAGIGVSLLIYFTKIKKTNKKVNA